jgi:hypothetical protein
VNVKLALVSSNITLLSVACYSFGVVLFVIAGTSTRVQILPVLVLEYQYRLLLLRRRPLRHRRCPLTCFTGTKVRILTLNALQGASTRSFALSLLDLLVQKYKYWRGRRCRGHPLALSHSAYLLYWYNSTNTDAEDSVGGIHSLFRFSSFMNRGYEFYDVFPAFFPLSVSWLCQVFFFGGGLLRILRRVSRLFISALFFLGEWGTTSSWTRVFPVFFSIFRSTGSGRSLDDSL